MGIFETPMNYEALPAGKDRPERPFGSLQWKGTDACIDLHCSCGHHGHFDGYFFSFYQCRSCHKVFQVGYYIKLYEVTDPQNLKAIMEDGPKESMIP